MENKIEKPWAVYGLNSGGIGKIVKEDGNLLLIKYNEDNYLPDFWCSVWVERFDSPIKAMAYFKFKNPKYTKLEVINYFLGRFPSERKNLKKLIDKLS
jgi:hypothetical protein